jgi:3-dehydroquinate dehydratase-2
VPILDALLTFEGPIVEVHISNIWRRESFRHQSYVSKAATGVIAGLGALGYQLALTAVAELLVQNA